MSRLQARRIQEGPREPVPSAPAVRNAPGGATPVVGCRLSEQLVECWLQRVRRRMRALPAAPAPGRVWAGFKGLAAGGGQAAAWFSPVPRLTCVQDSARSQGGKRLQGPDPHRPPKGVAVQGPLPQPSASTGDLCVWGPDSRVRLPPALFMPDSGETRATLSSSPLMRTVRVPTGLSARLAQAPAAGLSPVSLPQQEEKSPRRINFTESEELDSNPGSASSRPCGLRLVTQHLPGGGSGPPGKVDAASTGHGARAGPRGVRAVPWAWFCAAIHSLCASSRCWATKQVCAVASRTQEPSGTGHEHCPGRQPEGCSEPRRGASHTSLAAAQS